MLLQIKSCQMTEIKVSMDRLNNSVGMTDDNIIELEDKSVKFIQST